MATRRSDGGTGATLSPPARRVQPLHRPRQPLIQGSPGGVIAVSVTTPRLLSGASAHGVFVGVVELPLGYVHAGSTSGSAFAALKLHVWRSVKEEVDASRT